MRTSAAAYDPTECEPESEESGPRRKPQSMSERLDAMLRETDPKWLRAFAEVARRYPKKNKTP